MKRISVVLLLMIAALGANAQQKGYVCTGNYVNVRTGPGKNYEVYDRLEWGGDERDGWVSAQYLRPVTLCPECGGYKLVNIAEVDIDLDTCKKCKGKGYIK